jgi:hypothetical protein
MKKNTFLSSLLLVFLASGSTKNDIKDSLEIPIEIESEVEINGKNEVDKQKINNSLGFHQNLKKQDHQNHQLWDELLQKYVSESGKVNYVGFKKDKAKLEGYIKTLKEKRPQYQWTKQEILAYWINAYNALTIDLIIQNYPTKSIKDIKNPWGKSLWEFGDEWISLSQIEHKILREMDEPRIHFAIVCASVSCPKLQNKAFRPEILEMQLTAVTKEFLEDSNRNEIGENEIKISKIFKWFAKDFNKNGNLIDFLNQYLGIKISQKAKVSFKDYDWGLND